MNRTRRGPLQDLISKSVDVLSLSQPVNTTLSILYRGRSKAVDTTLYILEGSEDLMIEFE